MNASTLAKNFISEPSLSHQQVYDGIAHSGIIIRQKMNLEEFQCPRCNGKNSFKYLLNGNKFLACLDANCVKENVEAEKTRRTTKALKVNFSYFGIEEDYYMARMGNCSFPEEERSEEIISSMKQFISSPKGFFVLSGNQGIGKTFFSCAALIEFLNFSDDALFIRQSDINQKWLQIKSEGNSEYYYLEKLQQKKLLIIDDFGVRRPTEAFADFMFQLMDKRKNSNVGTILTTNLNSIQMAEYFGQSLTSRLIAGKCYRIKGRDRRAEKFNSEMS